MLHGERPSTRSCSTTQKLERTNTLRHYGSPGRTQGRMGSVFQGILEQQQDRRKRQYQSRTKEKQPVRVV